MLRADADVVQHRSDLRLGVAAGAELKHGQGNRKAVGGIDEVATGLAELQLFEQVNGERIPAVDGSCDVGRLDRDACQQVGGL